MICYQPRKRNIFAKGYRQPLQQTARRANHREPLSCPGRDAANFTLLCRAGPISTPAKWTPDQQRTRYSASKTRVNVLKALRSIRGTAGAPPESPDETQRQAINENPATAAECARCADGGFFCAGVSGCSRRSSLRGSTSAGPASTAGCRRSASLARRTRSCDRAALDIAFELQFKTTQPSTNAGGATYCALPLVSWAFCWSSFSSARSGGPV